MSVTTAPTELATGASDHPFTKINDVSNIEVIVNYTGEGGKIIVKESW